MSQLADFEDNYAFGETLDVFVYYWWVIALSVVLFASVAVYHAQYIAEVEYKAVSRFEILEQDAPSSALGSASGVALLGGLDFLAGTASEAEALRDRILSRPFLEKIYKTGEFEQDPTFRPASENRSYFYSDFISKLGFGASHKELSRTELLVIAVEELSSRLKITNHDNGIIELSVAHPNPQRASFIANLIVDQSLLDILEREREDSRASLNYFAEELLKVREELDAANAALRDFAISSSLQSAEELTRTSAQLSKVRRELAILDDSIVAIDNLDKSSFEGRDFVDSFPVANSISFRRLLNFTGDPENWSAPQEAKILSVKKQLQTQKNSLMASFLALEKRAQQSAAEALELSILEREVEVQKAIYESIISQFEAQSLFSGFERASGRLIEAAIPPFVPSSPKKKLIVGLAIILGFLLGSCLVLLKVHRSKIIVSEREFRRKHKYSTFHVIRKRVLSQVDLLKLKTHDRDAVVDVFFRLPSSSKSVALVPSSETHSVGKFAFLLSSVAARSGEETAIIDFAGMSGTYSTHFQFVGACPAFEKYEVATDIALYSMSEDSPFLVKDHAVQKLDELLRKFDRVIMLLPVPSRGVAIYKLLESKIDAVVVLSEKSQSTATNIESIQNELSSPPTVVLAV